MELHVVLHGGHVRARESVQCRVDGVILRGRPLPLLLPRSAISASSTTPALPSCAAAPFKEQDLPSVEMPGCVAQLLASKDACLCLRPLVTALGAAPP